MTFTKKINLGILLSTLLSAGFAIFFLDNHFSDSIQKQMLRRLIEVGQTGLFLMDKRALTAMEDYNHKSRELVKMHTPGKIKIAAGESKNYIPKEVRENIQKEEDWIYITQILRKIKSGSLKNTYPDYTSGNIPQRAISRIYKTTTIAYVYLLSDFDIQNNLAMFLSDADYEKEDKNKDGVIDSEEKSESVSIGQIYNIAEFPQLRNAFLTGKITYDEKITRDKWGAWFSVYIPVKNNSRTVAIMGLDLDANSEYNLLNDYCYLLFFLGGVIILLTNGISFFFTRKIIRPLKRLEKSAEKIVAGSYDLDIPVHSQDEVGHLARSFTRMVEVVRKNQENLETQVQNRTIELQESLSQLRYLKQKQDVDYFLAGLLALPLSKDMNINSAIKTEWFIEQKKKISYRNHQSQVGGDSIITASLLFRDRGHCVFFINTDAMGKSLQGAGGSVVIGSIVNAYLTPIAPEKDILNLVPEEWLQEIFINIQRVFESFQGNMYVSCIMGLVNEETGKMTYINADHPAPILFRDKTTGIMGQNAIMKKFGMADQGNPGLNILYLNPGDIVFIGSDGKDDLLKDGRRLEMDNTVFQNLIRTNDGNLNRILESISNNYELSDDISVLKISFKNESTSL